jgi:hypothetical protein
MYSANRRRSCVVTWVVGFLCLLASTAEAASVTVAWEAPADWVPSGYIVSYGTVPGVYTTQIDVRSARTYRIDALSHDIRYFVSVTAYNASRAMSEPSAEMTIWIPTPPSTGGGDSGGGGGGSSAPPSSPSPATAAGTSMVAHMRDGRTIDISWVAVGGASGYRVEVGGGPGLMAYSASTADTFISFDSATFPSAAYYVRVRAIVGGVPGAPSNEEVVPGGGMIVDRPTDAPAGQCTDVPGAPRQFSATANGTNVHLAWQAGTGAAPSSYVLQVGSAPGLSNLMVVPLPGGQTALSANAANGFYALRMLAMNSCGASVWGAEQLLAVGMPSTPGSGATPGTAPVLSQRVDGTLVTLTWTPPTGDTVTRYLVEAMTAGGPVSIDTGNPETTFIHPNTPVGEYVVTVRAGNAAGFGPPSAPVVVVVR